MFLSYWGSVSRSLVTRLGGVGQGVRRLEVDRKQQQRDGHSQELGALNPSHGDQQGEKNSKRGNGAVGHSRLVYEALIDMLPMRIQHMFASKGPPHQSCPGVGQVDRERRQEHHDRWGLMSPDDDADPDQRPQEIAAHVAQE